VLERVLRRIEVLAGEREDAATPREPRADAVPSPKEQAAPPPPEDPGVAKSRQEWRGERGAWSSRLSHNSSAAQSEAWHPSNRRYAALSPSFQQEDAMMPHRARGEVDEWASLVEVDRRRRAEESAAEAAAAARKRAAYAGEIGAMLDAKRVEAVRREEERGADLRRVEAQAAREQEAEARERAARRRGQEARREMFDAQLAERRRVKDEAAAEARREEQRLLAHVEVEQRREAEAERARAQAQQEEMHKVRADVETPPRTKWTRRVPHPVLIGHAASLLQVRADVERQIAEKRRAQEEERKRDVAVAKEYAEMMERRYAPLSHFCSTPGRHALCALCGRMAQRSLCPPASIRLLTSRRRERMRLDAEAERLERIGKLERLSNDNAARERQLRAEEDARFLAGLAEREAREEAALRARAAREAEERARYRAYLDHELASKTAARAGARAEERRAGEARAAAEQRAARVEADAAAQRAAAAKAAYRDALTGQMRGDAARRQHGWRMSERERALNRDLLDSYVRPPPLVLIGHAASLTPC